MIVNCNRNM